MLQKRAVRHVPDDLPVPPALVEASTEPDVIRVPARRTVTIEGTGSPEAPAFQQAIGALYGVAYGLKFARKPAGESFRIGPLEGRWWAAQGGLDKAPRDAWRWKLRIAVPANATAREVAAVVRAASEKKGGKLEGSEAVGQVVLERIPAQRLGRILHVGPYADEPASFARLEAALARAGLRRAGPHLELYLSDPRRTAPARLRTVLLAETTPAASS